MLISNFTLKKVNPIDLAWQTAQRYALENYSQSQLADIASAKSVEDVLKHLQSLQSKTATKAIFQFYETFRGFLGRIAQYEEILKIYSNSHMAIAILWGSVNLLLMVSRKALKYLDLFAKVLDELSDHLPRMQLYAALFSDSARLRDILAAVYRDLMDFCILATHSFGRKSFSLLRKIIWGDFEVRSSRIVASLSEHRDLLDLEANACHTVEARYEKHQQNSHRELVESLEVIKWLSPADTEDHLDKLQRLRTECTGMWFFARAEYVNWVEGTQKLLWVNGIPGCGKSVLCSSLIAHLVSNQSRSQVSYFFCDDGHSMKRTAIGVLRSLIAQLIAGKSDLVQLAREVVIRSGQETARSFSRLMSLFKSIIERSSSATYVIIDGLDECDDGPNSGLLQTITELAATQPLYLGVFSRSESWLRRVMSTWPSVEITSQAIERDMTIYVQTAIERPPLSRLSDETLAQRIKQTLIEKADGQFLWTRLMIETLEKATFVSEINQILSDVPLGLGQLYGRILERLLTQPSRRQIAAQLLFSWLACAERHLTMSELATALAVRPGATEIHPDDLVINLRGFLEDVGGSLVRVSEPNKDQSEPVISFVHLTVREYLLASEELWSSVSAPVAKFRVDSSKANQDLASVCVTYLSFDIFQTLSENTASIEQSNLSNQHLLDYAALYWVQHLVKSGRPSIDLLRRLYLFLQSDRLLAFIERTVALNNAGFSISNLIVSQSLLNDWIQQCDAEDPRLAMVSDCFRIRLEDAVKGRSALLGGDHSETVKVKFQLAQLLHFRGDWAMSARLHREVMNVRVRTSGEKNRTTLNSMYWLACVLRRLGKHDESRNLQTRALQYQEEILGHDDPDTLRSEDGLAKILSNQGLLEESEVASRATLVRKNRIFGSSSLEAALTMDVLASILKEIGLRHKERGRNALAMQALWECESISRNGLVIRETHLGEDNPQTITCINMLGLVLRHLKRPEESELYHRRALQTRQKVLGPNNPHTQNSVRNLRSVLLDQGRISEAQEFEQMLQASQTPNRDLPIGEGGSLQEIQYR